MTDHGPGARRGLSPRRAAKQRVYPSTTPRPGIEIAAAIAVTVLLLAVSPLGIGGSIALQYLIPPGMPSLTGLNPLFMMLGMFAGVCAPIALAITFVRERRAVWMVALVAVCALFWGTHGFAYTLVRQSQRFGVAKVAGSARPIIKALDQYRNDHGGFPKDLEALSPRYLERMPDTGLAAFPKFSYRPETSRSGAVSYDLSTFASHGFLEVASIHYLNDVEDREEYWTVVVEDWGLLDD